MCPGTNSIGRHNKVQRPEAPCTIRRRSKIPVSGMAKLEVCGAEKSYTPHWAQTGCCRLAFWLRASAPATSRKVTILGGKLMHRPWLLDPSETQRTARQGHYDPSSPCHRLPRSFFIPWLVHGIVAGQRFIGNHRDHKDSQENINNLTRRCLALTLSLKTKQLRWWAWRTDSPE